jgi:acyl carrier protein
MDRGQALTNVTAVLSDELGVPVEEITVDRNLRDDLSMDSLDLIELVSGLEDQFGKPVPTARLKAVHTIGDVVDLVLELAAAQQAAA